MMKKLEDIYTKTKRKESSHHKYKMQNLNKNLSNDRDYTSWLRDIKDNKRKLEIFKITQNNQMFLKRLIQSKTCYIPNTNTHFPKLENPNLNRCRSVNKNNSNKKILSKNEISTEKNFGYAKKNTIDDLDSITDQSYYKFNKKLSTSGRSKSSNINLENYKDVENTKIVLYKRHCFINNLSIVYLEFILIEKK